MSASAPRPGSSGDVLSKRNECPPRKERGKIEDELRRERKNNTASNSPLSKKGSWTEAGRKGGRLREKSKKKKHLLLLWRRKNSGIAGASGFYSKRKSHFRRSKKRKHVYQSERGEKRSMSLDRLGGKKKRNIAPGGGEGELLSLSRNRGAGPLSTLPPAMQRKENVRWLREKR